MSHFSESFQKELGKGFAQLLLGAATVLFAILAGLIGGDKQLARILLLCLSGIAALLLASGLLFRYFSYCKSQQKIQELEKQLSRANFLVRFQEIIYGKDSRK